ncbi:MAG TPA: hypothetical protein VHE59_16250 [Mucilaginibacter sp.]|nr:hypothetical protein [Mucilaginibacter sp.]
MIKHSTYTLFLALFVLPVLVAAQDIKESPAFFSLRNSKLSMGLGIEGASSSFMGNASTPTDMIVQYKDTRQSGDSYPYVSGGIAFDLYSDNSLLGLLFGANYSVLTTTYQKENVSTDYFSVTRAEFPFYLKIRPGYVNAKNHVWLLLGGIYSLPLSVQRDYEVAFSQTQTDVSYTDQNLSQAMATISASASLGYEGYLTSSKSTRIAIFITATYPLSNQFNSSYVEFLPGGRSVFANYPGFDARDLRTSFGVKYLFKLGKSKL